MIRWLQDYILGDAGVLAYIGVLAKQPFFWLAVVFAILATIPARKGTP